MILRALLVIASGFIFIFSPGLPMNLISRYSPEYERDLVYWGIGAWLISLLPGLFFQSLFRQIIYQGQSNAGFSGRPLDFAVLFLNALLSGLFLGVAMLLVLRYKRNKNPDEDVTINGLALGFGAGLVAQVFTGITLVGAGFQVLFGNTTANITVEAIAESPLGLLLASLAALIVFRIALLSVSAVQGFLTARSVLERKGQFWAGVLIYTGFTGLLLTLHLIMGETIPGRVSVGLTPPWVSVATIIYYLIAFLAAYRWLSKKLQS